MARSFLHTKSFHPLSKHVQKKVFEAEEREKLRKRQEDRRKMELKKEMSRATRDAASGKKRNVSFLYAVPPGMKKSPPRSVAPPENTKGRPTDARNALEKAAGLSRKRMKTSGRELEERFPFLKGAPLAQKRSEG